MRKNLFFVFLVLFIASCTAEEKPATEEPVSDDVLLKKLEESNAEIRRLTEELNRMQEIIQPPVLPQPPSALAELADDSFSSSDPRVYLARMDTDLEAVAKGENPKGSFSDWFVINAAYAFRAGASKREIEARIERVVAFAEKGVFYSTSVHALMNDGGANAIREYANDIIFRGIDR